jgi:4'-phosphopantetheinyl transferase
VSGQDSEGKNVKPSWNVPPTQLLLSRKDVHIWRAVLDLPSNNVRKLKESLSIDERMKAEHFRFERDRSRFITARGILRLILGCYLSVEPSAIRFCYKKNGKPRLQNRFAKTGIQFNLSHSEGLALYVFARDHEVGVDIERIRDFPETEQMVEQFFSAREIVVFRTLSGSKKQETFFSWWTRKEAFVKATGDGLSYPIDTFDASAVPGKSIELFRILGDAEEASEWSIGDVRPAEEFAGAVAVEGGNWEVQCWQWPEQSKRN